MASRMLHSENPLSPEPVMVLPMKPPMNAPTMPISMVTMMPPGSLPGMRALAIAPAISPSTIQARIPISEPPKVRVDDGVSYRNARTMYGRVWSGALGGLGYDAVSRFDGLTVDGRPLEA